ncbi:MAG TPA: polyamine aminopropyltransferase [Actinomycetota bacterium]|nr:polyamine aminopropyltransferase [Actinomycetota bacterium]
MIRFHEQIAPGLQYAYEAALLASEKSAFQLIEVYEHPAFGRVLVLDGLVQTSERDEFPYHEMLTHVPMIAHAEPRRVLIIGGGDGGTLRHVLMHPSVERAVMVEIDQRVTELCREFMPSISGEAWNDARAEVRFDDGIAFVRDTDEQFDVILVDSSDPVGPGEGLFTPAFYADAKARLAPGGILAAQSGSPFFQQDELHRTYKNASSVFGDEVRIYQSHTPTYPGCLWTFALCAGSPGTVDEARKRARARHISARYWTPELMRGAFDLNGIARAVIAPDGPPNTWGSSPGEEDRRALS